ncbi:hypothetical protein GOODEAATRI_033573 [Goodea atripinnis]|uniref:Uncharacterized protein n=1 Tax=Goodea atripinnis TaxID=208336 RepID=A0ABV0NZT4_9TELE
MVWVGGPGEIVLWMEWSQLLAGFDFGTVASLPFVHFVWVFWRGCFWLVFGCWASIVGFGCCGSSRWGALLKGGFIFWRLVGPWCVDTAGLVLLGLALVFSYLYWGGVCLSAECFLVGGVSSGLVVFTMSLWTYRRMCGVSVAVVLAQGQLLLGSIGFAWLAWMLVVLHLGGVQHLCSAGSGLFVAPFGFLGWR